MHYYVLTGVHVIHVLIGLVFLAVLWRELRGAPTPRVELVEAGGTYWHMVDFLWFVIFALLVPDEVADAAYLRQPVDLHLAVLCCSPRSSSWWLGSTSDPTPPHQASVLSDAFHLAGRHRQVSLRDSKLHGGALCTALAPGDMRRLAAVELRDGGLLLRVRCLR